MSLATRSLIASLGFALAWYSGVISPRNGQESAEALDARDVVADFRLPPLLNEAADIVRQDEQNTQVLTRSRMLNVNEGTATAAWALVQSSFAAAGLSTGPKSIRTPPTEFRGALASELNRLLATGNISSIAVTSAKLQIDTPILLNRDGIDLDLGHAELIDPSGGPYMVRIEDAKNVNLRGGIFVTGKWGLLIARGSRITVDKTAMRGLTGGGIVVTQSNNLTIARNLFQGLAETAVLLHGNTQLARVIHNRILGNLGASNWKAGIVLTDRNVDLVTDPENLFGGDGHSVPGQPITARLTTPQNNLIAYNRIAGNASSGIYSDGSIRNVFVNNQIENNSKEGLCLDNGSAADVVAFNLFRGNGQRWGQTDGDLKLDSVLQFGRLPDGTSPAKLPGISLDNTAYNQVVFNEVDANFGSGIKMVRTAFYNLIGANTLSGNNLGRNDLFHFFGIELGFASPDGPSDAPFIDLDFAPSRGNEIFANNIRGGHYSGIFFAERSDQNTLFDNTIFGATDWGMESVVAQRNITLNNLTNLRLRNMSSGLNPPLTARR
jgi:hypothetical protein